MHGVTGVNASRVYISRLIQRPRSRFVPQLPYLLRAECHVTEHTVVLYAVTLVVRKMIMWAAAPEWEVHVTGWNTLSTIPSGGRRIEHPEDL